MTYKRPHDQRFWEPDEWECGWIEMTQMLLLYISAHLYVVFLKSERALEYLYLGSVACARVEDEALSGMFVFTFIPHCVSTVFPYVSVSLASCWKTAGRCVFVCVCVDAGCTVDSTLSDFVSGFLTHVLMAIKDFSLFGIHSPEQFFLFDVWPNANGSLRRCQVKIFQGLYLYIYILYSSWERFNCVASVKFVASYFKQS